MRTQVEPNAGIDSRSVSAIENVAKDFLSKNLNSGRMVAVVGSGVSAGYGLPSWTEMTLSAIDRSMEEFGSNTMELEQLQKIRKYLGTTSDPNKFTTALQYCSHVVGPNFRTIFAEISSYKR